MTRRRMLIALGCLVVLGVVAVAVAPSIIERQADRKLRARLDAAGVGGEWKTLEFTYAGGLTLEGLVLWRGASRFETQHLNIKVDTRSALLGQVRVDAIDIGPWNARFGLPADTDTDADPVRRTPSIDRLVELLGNNPTVQVAPGQLVVHRAEVPLAIVDVSGVQAMASESGLEGVATGTFAARVEGITAHPWTANGRWDPMLGRAELSVRGPEDAPLVEVRRGPVDVSLGAVSVKLEAGRRTLRAQDIRGSAGPVTGQVKHGRLAKVRGQWGLTLTDGDLSVSLGAESDVDTGAPSAVTLPTEPPLPIRVEDVDVELRVGTRELVGRLSAAEVEGSRWTARAEFGGGAVIAELDLIPGSLKPRQVTLRLDEVDTEALQQSLRRNWRRPIGRRAALAGRLSGVVSLFPPPEWPEVPLDPDGPLWVESQLRLDDGVVDWDGVHDKPIGGIDGRAAISARWDPGHALEVVAQLGHKALRGYVAFDLLELDGDGTAELVVSVDPIDCQSALDALPRSLLGPYSGIRANGHITPWLKINVPLKTPVRTKMVFQGMLGRCEIERLNAQREAWPTIKIDGRVVDNVATARVDDVGWMYLPFVMSVREGTSKEVEVGPGLETYVPITSLPEYVGAAAYLSEEMEFYNNGAISPGLILRALRLNLERKRFVYGGSTVTQQLVKNLYLTRGKTLVRKFREALIAGRIVDEVSKERVLELYLNCIEFGPNVYGIGPAAQFYFQKNARDLSPKEAVFLAMLKPAPYQGRMMMRRGYTANYPWWRDRYALMMNRLVERGAITPEEAEAERPYMLYWEKKKYLGSKTAVRDPYE